MRARLLLLAFVLLVIVAQLAGPGPSIEVSAQNKVFGYAGLDTCANSKCHKNELKWFKEEDGRPPTSQHQSARKWLAPTDPKDKEKVTKYMAAMNIMDAFDPKGGCVQCHAPVPNPKQRKESVTCEVCHGFGKAYLDPHKEEPFAESYKTAVKLQGMKPLLKNPGEWAPMCMDCHVLSDAALIKAGHPDGDDFDLSQKYKSVASANGDHWKSKYAGKEKEILGPANKKIAEIKARRTPKSVAPAPVAAPPVAPPPATPPGATPPVAAPPVATPPVATPPVAAPPVAAPPVAAPPVAAPPLTPPPATPPSVTPPPLTLPPTGAKPLRRPPPPVDDPKPPPPVIVPKEPDPEPPPPVSTVLPRSPAALVAAVRGKAIQLLADLLKRGGVGSMRVRPMAPPTSYTGPDAELLRLQQEALQLALEALGSPPAPSPR